MAGGEEVVNGVVIPPPKDVIEIREFRTWSFYRAIITEFVSSMVLLYITMLVIIGNEQQIQMGGPCAGVGTLGVAWAFGGVIFALVYCTAGVSGGHVNPAVTLGCFMTRMITLPRAVGYMIAQCLGAICGAGLAKGWQRTYYEDHGGGTNFVHHGYTKGSALGAEIVGTFVLLFVVLCASDPKRKAKDTHVPVLAPLPIGFAVLVIHLATIPITNTSINPARSLAPAILYNSRYVWNDQWIFWVGPFLGAAIAATLQNYVLSESHPFMRLEERIARDERDQRDDD